MLSPLLNRLTRLPTWLQWLGLSAIGWLAGWCAHGFIAVLLALGVVPIFQLLPEPADSGQALGMGFFFIALLLIGQGIVGGAALGLVSALIQRQLLNRALPSRPPWLRANLIGWTLAGLLSPWLTAARDAYSFTSSLTLLALITGILVIAQWLALRNYVAHSWRWVALSLGGAALAAALVHSPGDAWAFLFHGGGRPDWSTRPLGYGSSPPRELRSFRVSSTSSPLTAAAARICGAAMDRRGHPDGARLQSARL